MRILQFVTRSEPRGAEIFAAQLSSELAQRQHEVVFAALYSSPPESGRALELEGVRRVELDGRVKGRIEFPVMRRMWKLIRSTQPDVVQANAFHALKYAVILKRVLRAPWPIVYRNISIASHWIRNEPKRRWGSWLLRSADMVASVSNASARDICATYRVSPSRVITIRRGIRIPTVIDRQAARERLSDLIGPVQDKTILFHIGGFTPEKNHLGLLEAFRQIRQSHPSAHLVLCGDGPLRSKIVERIAAVQLSRHVHLLGYRSDARELLSGSELLLLSSEIEGIPGVVLEAAVQGIPTVATDVGAISEAVLDGESGMLVPSGEMGALAQAATGLLSNAPRRRQMGQAARESVVRLHSMKFAVDRFEQLYQDMVQGGRSSASQCAR